MNNDNFPNFARTPSHELVPGSGIYTDFNYPSRGLTNYHEATVWEGLGDNFNKAGDYVWNAGAKTWDKAKIAVSSVEDVALGGVDKAMGLVTKYFIFVIGGLVILIYFLGKSGLGGNAAQGATAFFGRG